MSKVWTAFVNTIVDILTVFRRSVSNGEKEKKKKEKSRGRHEVFLPLCSNVVSIIQREKEKFAAVCSNLSARWRKQMVMRQQWTKQKHVTALLRSTPNTRMHQDHLPSLLVQRGQSPVNHIQIQLSVNQAASSRGCIIYSAFVVALVIPSILQIRKISDRRD